MKAPAAATRANSTVEKTTPLSSLCSWIRRVQPLRSALSMRLAHERLRPPVQLADSVPGTEVGIRLDLLEFPIAASRDADEPRGTGERQAQPLPIVTHHLAEGGDHGRRLATLTTGGLGVDPWRGGQPASSDRRARNFDGSPSRRRVQEGVPDAAKHRYQREEDHPQHRPHLLILSMPTRLGLYAVERPLMSGTEMGPARRDSDPQQGRVPLPH